MPEKKEDTSNSTDTTVVVEKENEDSKPTAPEDLVVPNVDDSKDNKQEMSM